MNEKEGAMVRVVEAAQVACQWLDYHAEEVEKWGGEEAAVYERLHLAVSDYEAILSRGEEEG